jgi:epoxide hydrolase-like predicted phosphatase
MSGIAVVVFDIGGVVQDSPLHAIARYEHDHGIEPGAINRAVVAAGERGAWARLERGELTVASFCAPFEAECRALGIHVDGARLMTAIADAGLPRPRMLQAIRRIRARDLRVGALTNNWVMEGSGQEPPGHALREHFDVFVESAVVGLRKPDCASTCSSASVSAWRSRASRSSTTSAAT